MDALTSEAPVVKRRSRFLIGALLAAGLLATAAGGVHGYATQDHGPAATAGADSATGEQQALAPHLVQLRLRGEGFALGQRHGALLRDDIQFMVKYLQRELLHDSAVARDAALLKAWQLDRHIPERFRQELRGVAEGAGVAYGDVLLINTYDDLMHLLGCSSAVLLPGADETPAARGTAAITPLRHARNLDYPIGELARHKVVFDIETHGTRLRTVGFPGYIGVLTGMSSRGLGLSSHTSKAKQDGVGVPSGILYRQVLEEAATLEQAVALLRGSARTIGNNLALSDAAHGQALAVELSATRLATRAPQGGRLYVTNHFQSAPMQPQQVAAFYQPGSGSVARVQCLEASLPPGKALSVAAVEKALSQEGGRGGPGWRTPANRGTIQSVVMEPATGRLYVATGATIPVTRGGYLELPGLWPATSP